MLQGEGVAYRGRILVELSTILESKPVNNKKLEIIPNDDLLVVEVTPCFVGVGNGNVPLLVIFGE